MAGEGRVGKRWIAKHGCIYRYETGIYKEQYVIFVHSKPRTVQPVSDPSRTSGNIQTAFATHIERAE